MTIQGRNNPIRSRRHCTSRNATLASGNLETLVLEHFQTMHQDMDARMDSVIVNLKGRDDL